MVNSSSAPELPALLSEAVEYAQMHFRVEEEMLSRAKYPGLTNQQQAHQTYNIQVKELMLQNKMNPHMVSQDLLYFLKKWWINHILEEDLSYALHLQKQE